MAWGGHKQIVKVTGHILEEVYKGGRLDAEFSSPLLISPRDMDSQPLPRGKACLLCRYVRFEDSVFFIADTCAQRSQGGSWFTPLSLRVC